MATDEVVRTYFRITKAAWQHYYTKTGRKWLHKRYAEEIANARASS